MNEQINDTVREAVQAAGAVLKKHFGKVRNIRMKEGQSSVVTDADFEAEQVVIDLIRARFPQHRIIAEESGSDDPLATEWTWVVDPLDGTSNYAVGLPWFGVMVSVLERGIPQVAAMYLPLEDALYWAEVGQGATRNGQSIRVSTEANLANVLCACGIDAAADADRIKRQMRFLEQLVQRARNLRGTNSLVDFAGTIDGRFGAVVNFNTKIWDIAAPSLILAEAGGRLTYLDGSPITFDLGPGACARSYAVLGANPILSEVIGGLASGFELF